MMLEVDICTICRFFQDNGFTHQKLVQVAIQRNEHYHQRFLIDISVYRAEMLVFIDETCADQRNCHRKRGYSLRGMPLQKHDMFVRGVRMSAIAMMSIRGILDVFVTSGTVDGQAFYEFTEKYLLPQLQPFDGINPHSVVHHVPNIVEMIEEVGAIVHFLPPCSPDYNPIEIAFSKVKGKLQDLETSMIANDTETVLMAAFTSITEEDSKGWFSHCGYLSE